VVTDGAIDVDELIVRAVETAGADDFGEDSWQEGLSILVDGLNGEAELNDVGDAMAAGELLAYLVNRLQILEWRRSHPEVVGVPITRPIFIVGQPRTGTTILYDLLAQDPANRVPLTWEVDHPTPPPRTDSYEDDPRIATSQAMADMADLVIPGFTAFHPIGARLAQECVRIKGSDFRSMIFPVQYRIPTYNHWLIHETDLAPTYRWHRIFLEHLQSGHMAERWLLKSPAHLWYLPALMAEYPDAVVIQTHRDPLKVIASVSALTAHLRQMASDHHSIAEAAAQYCDDIFVGLERGLEARADGTLPADQVVDVQFADFAADPFATIAALYDQLGLELSDDADHRMRRFLAEHPGDGGGGGTRYTWTDTGLDGAALRQRARAYQQRFGVPSEPIE
jgi:hypothetical protein